MTASLPWLMALGPLALVLGGLAPAGGARASVRAATVAALVALAVAVVAALACAAGGPAHTPTLCWHGAGFCFSLDALSAVMSVLVAFVGLVVVRYSRNYLDGDPGQPRFMRWLCLTLAAVLTLIGAGNLVQLALAWIATSLALHRLLLFYPERPYAVLAARKKFVASRLGDACVLLAAVLVARVFGTLDHATVAQAVAALRAAGAAPPLAAQAAALLLAVAALLKSAQVPMHGWLTEVMETPTPVSALLHAGVINAGGFLVLRFAGLISLSAPALDLLVVVGGFTALFASVVMLTQTSVKVALAWSTIAQMGFMLLECGLGAFATALLHIVAHSLYKAHAFLASGSVIDLARASWTPRAGGGLRPARVAVAAVLALAVAAGVAVAAGAGVLARPGAAALGAVLMLGLVHLVTQGMDARPSAAVLGRVLALAAIVAAAYVGLQALVERVAAGALPPAAPLRGAFDLAMIVLVVASFALVTVAQAALPGAAHGSRWLAAWMHLSNGLYLNTLANRLALRLWPRAAPMRAGLEGRP